MTTRLHDAPLLGDWACLGALVSSPAHGFAVASRLAPTGDIGRVWSLSRALTYRSLDNLVARGWAEVVAEETGTPGGARRVLAATADGRAALDGWLHEPVEHVRDMRSALLLKLVVAPLCGVDVGPLLDRQRTVLLSLGSAVDEPDDVVALWRREVTAAALRVVETMLHRRADRSA